MAAAVPNVKAGDIVQISIDARVTSALRGALAVVAAVCSWGIIAMVNSFYSVRVVHLKYTGLAYVRVAFGEFEPTGGKAVWAARTGEELH